MHLGYFRLLVNSLDFYTYPLLLTPNNYISKKFSLVPMKTNLVQCWLLRYSQHASVLTVQISKSILLTSELSFSIPSRKCCREGHSNIAAKPSNFFRHFNLWLGPLRPQKSTDLWQWLVLSAGQKSKFMIPFTWVCGMVELTSWFTIAQVRLSHVRYDHENGQRDVLTRPGHGYCLQTSHSYWPQKSNDSSTEKHSPT